MSPVRSALGLSALALPLFTAGCSGQQNGDDYSDPCKDTPLVLSFDNLPVEYVSELDSAYFDIGQHDSALTTYWPTARTPWLARDLNANGLIDDGKELLGSETMLADGLKARDGFEALAELDLNADGRVDTSELTRANLLVWRDQDSDRESLDGELATIDSEKILWIELPPSSLGVRAPRCDANGNCEIARSSFGYLDVDGVERRGTVIDIDLPFVPRPGADDPNDEEWDEDDWDDDGWNSCY